MAQRARRRFPPQFKAEVIVTILSGCQSQAEVCHKHGRKPELVARGKKTVLERLPVVFDGPAPDGVAQARVAERERVVGRLTLELDAAKEVSAARHSMLGGDARS